MLKFLSPPPRKSLSTVFSNVDAFARGLVPIKDIKVGDMVVTRHEADQPDVTYLRRVDEVRKQYVSPKDLHVFQSNDENIWVTRNHPFFVEGKKNWISAANITTSHALQSIKGKQLYRHFKILLPVFYKHTSFQTFEVLNQPVVFVAVAVIVTVCTFKWYLKF